MSLCRGRRAGMGILLGRGPAMLAHRGHPALGFVERPPQIKHEESRQRTDCKNDAPGFRSQRIRHSDQIPDDCRQQRPCAETRLQKAAPFWPRAVGPGFSDQRDARAPFASDRKPGDEAQEAERQEAVRKGGKPGKQGIEEHGIHHHPLAADIIGQHAPQQTADSPAEKRDADRRSGIESRRLRLLWREQRFHCKGQGDDERVGFVAVEDPAEIAAPEDAPVPAREAGVPGCIFRRCHGRVAHCHVVLPW